MPSRAGMPFKPQQRVQHDPAGPAQHLARAAAAGSSAGAQHARAGVRVRAGPARAHTLPFHTRSAPQAPCCGSLVPVYVRVCACVRVHVCVRICVLVCRGWGMEASNSAALWGQRAPLSRMAVGTEGPPLTQCGDTRNVGTEGPSHAWLWGQRAPLSRMAVGTEGPPLTQWVVSVLCVPHVVYSTLCVHWAAGG